MDPLRESFANGQIEGELKTLFCELFEGVALDTFDVNVLGAPHLGSFDLVRRAVTSDGLVLLNGEHQEDVTRHLYRAWKSGNAQKRGLHFLRTYLHLLFPGERPRVNQLYHKKSVAYGTGFVSPLTSRKNLDTSQLFLTSRVEIELGVNAIAANIAPTEHGVSERKSVVNNFVFNAIQSSVSARLVPHFAHRIECGIHAASAVTSRGQVSVYPKQISRITLRNTTHAASAVTSSGQVSVYPKQISRITLRNTTHVASAITSSGQVSVYPLSN